jgi:hypothetical protein
MTTTKAVASEAVEAAFKTCYYDHSPLQDASPTGPRAVDHPDNNGKAPVVKVQPEKPPR